MYILVLNIHLSDPDYWVYYESSEDLNDLLNLSCYNPGGQKARQRANRPGAPAGTRTVASCTSAYTTAATIMNVQNW